MNNNTSQETGTLTQITMGCFLSYQNWKCRSSGLATDVIRLDVGQISAIYKIWIEYHYVRSVKNDQNGLSMTFPL